LLKNAGDSKAALLQPAIGRQRRNMELSFHPSIRGGSIIQERIVDFGTQPTGAHLRRVDDRKGLLFRLDVSPKQAVHVGKVYDFLFLLGYLHDRAIYSSQRSPLY